VRLDAQGDGATVEDRSIALLRRAAASVTKLLAQARAGFEAERMTTAWLDAAVRVAREARAKLTQAPNVDSKEHADERALVDELVSVELIGTLAEAERALRDVEEVHGKVEEALRAELAYRESRGFMRVDAPASLERYVARSSELKRHFERALQLDHVAHASTDFAPFARLAERLRAWYTGQPYRFGAPREWACRLSGGAMVARGREFCSESAHLVADRAVSRIDYVHRGFVRAMPVLEASGVTAIRHRFRFDLSFFAAAIEVRHERVPVLDREARVRVVEAPRRERARVAVSARYDDRTFSEAATLIVDRRGVVRVER